MKLIKIILSALLTMSCCVKQPLIETRSYEVYHTREKIVGVPLEESQTFIDLKVCHHGTNKTYMEWLKTSPTSRQGKFMRTHMSVQEGLLFDDDGYIGVALGSYFGEIGDRFIFTLSTGIVLKLIKIEEKSDRHTNNGCEQKFDHSVIEFVVDLESNSFYIGSNGLIANGNFNHLKYFKGSIVRIQKELK